MLRKRNVIYREKSLDYFKVTNKNSFYACFCKALWATQATMLQKGIVWRNVARLFNDAHYIYEEVNLSHCPERKMPEYREYLRPKIGYSQNEATLVVNTKLIAVYWLLRYSPGRTRVVDDFIRFLEDDLRKRCRSLFDAFYHEMYGGDWSICCEQNRTGYLTRRLINAARAESITSIAKHIIVEQFLNDLKRIVKRMDDEQDLFDLAVQIYRELNHNDSNQLLQSLSRSLMVPSTSAQTNANISIAARHISFYGNNHISDIYECSGYNASAE